MLTKNHRELVAVAVDHAVATHDGDAHTVAAAILTRSGRVILGLNTHHFLGGPCGEISALSNHAAHCPDDPIVAVVAAYGPTASVIAPCGKCRQILFDLDPNIECIIRAANGLQAHTVRVLLPHAYDWQAMEAPQLIYMWEGYETLIREGRKRQTIRVDDPFRPGPAVLVFEKGNGETITIDAHVDQVRTVSRAALSEQDALLDGFDCLESLHAALDQHYPDLPGDTLLDIVKFSLPAAPPETEAEVPSVANTP
ncbi:ASCH domain-containing protein [Rhodococcus sp. As11]|uniref:ASCH domain-containing protein n=1 Tax=Rhodococcus sp. As11 TaxID=3029189 RepID=UPI003B79A596